MTSKFNYLMNKEDLESVKVEFIEGDKAGSKWLVMDNIHILHRYGTESKAELFWESSTLVGSGALACFHFSSFLKMAKPSG